MIWTAKSTGDMTLAICEGSRIVLRIDMLRQNIMKAGDEGRRLCIAINDLYIIARASTEDISLVELFADLPYLEEGNSPFPWRANFDGKRITIKNAEGRLICDKTVAKNNIEQIKSDYIIIVKAIEKINMTIHTH